MFIGVSVSFKSHPLFFDDFHEMAWIYLQKWSDSDTPFIDFHDFRENGAQNRDSILVFGLFFGPGRDHAPRRKPTYSYTFSWYLTRWGFMKSTKKRSLAFVLCWWFSSPGPTLPPFRGEAAQNLQKPIRLLILLEHIPWFLLKSNEKTYIFVVKFGDFWRGPISGSAQVSENNNKYIGFRDAFFGKTWKVLQKYQ